MLDGRRGVDSVILGWEGNEEAEEMVVLLLGVEV